MQSTLRRLLASNNPPANACYVSCRDARAQASPKTSEHREKREWPVLIFEQRTTGDVFVVPDPQLRLDEVEACRTKSPNCFTKR